MAQTEGTLAMPKFDKPVSLLIVAGGPGRAALIAAAKAKASAGGATVEVVEAPDVLSLPTTVAMAERLAEFDGYIVLAAAGLADEVRHEVWHALGLLGLQGLSIGNGVGSGEASEAAIAALHLVAISRKWAGKTKGIGFRA